VHAGHHNYINETSAHVEINLASRTTVLAKLYVATVEYGAHGQV